MFLIVERLTRAVWKLLVTEMITVSRKNQRRIRWRGFKSIEERKCIEGFCQFMKCYILSFLYLDFANFQITKCLKAVPILVPKLLLSTQILIGVMLMLIQRRIFLMMKQMTWCRQICRLGNKAMLKAFLVDNFEIDLDMMDPEGELHIKKTDTPDWQVYDIAAGKTVLNDRGSPRSSHQDCPVWWDSGDIVWARGRVWGWWTALGTHPCTMWFCTTPPPCRLWTSCCRRGLM